MSTHPSDRQVPTRRILTQAKVTVRPRDGSRPSRQEFVDLSMGGTFIKTMFTEEIGTVVDLELDLFYAKLRIAAEVCWTRGYEKGPDEPYGMGLKFLDLTSAQKKLLYRHIGELAKRGGRWRRSGTDRRSGEDRRKENGGFWNAFFRRFHEHRIKKDRRSRQDRRVG